MQTPQIDVVRAFPSRAVLRAVDPEADTPTNTFDHLMEVRWSAYDTWYEIDSYWEGTFLERTVKGAFAQTIAEDRDQMKVLYDHGFDPQIGNKVLGPIDDLREDADSPIAEVPLFDTTYNRDLLPGLIAGVYGSSFRFRVQAESWAEPGTKEWVDTGVAEWAGLEQRTITQAWVGEFGPVTFPANPTSTAGMRSRGCSLTDSYYETLKRRDETAFDAAVRSATRSMGQGWVPIVDGKPDFTGRPGARSTGGGGTDVEPLGGDTSHLIDRHRAARLAGLIPGDTVAHLPKRGNTHG
jgi:phage head maturation protease